MGIKVRTTYLEKPQKISLIEREIELGEDEVLVKMYQASICDADRMFYRGHWLGKQFTAPTFFYPFYLGHEGGGTVLEVGGKVREFQPGDRVCAYGRAQTFSNISSVKVHNLQKIPDDLEFWLGCMGEPLCVPMFAVFDAPLCLGDVVAVTGMGFNGHIIAQAAKKSGASTVICIDTSDKKLALAKKLGADIIINSDKTPVEETIKDVTRGKGADIVFDGTGYAHHDMERNIEIATNIVKNNGSISIPNWIAYPINVNMARWHHHGLDIRFPALMHHGPEQRKLWVEKNLLVPFQRGMIDVASLITSRFPLDKIEEAFKEMDENLDVVKIVIDIGMGE